MISSAVVSDCGLYRYRLTRSWNDCKPPMCVVMLNPSTADHSKDDPTIRRCVGFAQRLGFGSVVVVNLSAYRATDPADWHQAGRLIGPLNDSHITEVAVRAMLWNVPVVLAWGANAREWVRADEVVTLIRGVGASVAALDFTSDGVPRHPLMLSYNCVLRPYGK